MEKHVYEYVKEAFTDDATNMIASHPFPATPFA